jgi:hypothetical protein
MQTLAPCLLPALLLLFSATSTSFISESDSMTSEK